MKITAQQIIQAIQKDKGGIDEIMKDLIENYNNEDNSFSWYDAYDDLETIFSYLSSYEPLNLNLGIDKHSSECDFELLLTLWQPVGKSKIGKCIIWNYDITFDLDDLNSFATQLADLHNEIEEEFNF